MKILCLLIVLGSFPSLAWAQAGAPVFDVHLHANAADSEGPPPLGMCVPFRDFGAWDPAEPYAVTFLRLLKEPPCDDPVWSPETDAEVRDQTIDAMERRNMFGVLSGTLGRVSDWQDAAPGRFLRGLSFNVASTQISPDSLRGLVDAGLVDVLAEVTNQYAGVAPDDERMAPYWALAEELDLPVGIHLGTGPPGVRYLGPEGYRADLHSALTLEPVLVRHPRLRVYVMHAGWPMIDDLLALLYVHPQVYVDIGVIVFTSPNFDDYLRRIVDAGFSKRVMFGSDQMVWPGVIEPSIERIERAPYLTEQQKRDILYNNAARFFRFTPADVARHGGM